MAFLTDCLSSITLKRFFPKSYLGCKRPYLCQLIHGLNQKAIVRATGVE